MSQRLVGLIPFVPLMKHDDPPEKVLEMCVRRIESEVADEEERSTLYLCLGVLSSLKYPKEMILNVLEMSKMEKSPLFNGIREEWEARGIVKGREEGRFEGITESILEALEENTGKKPEKLRETLLVIKDGDLLKKILRRAVKAKNLEDFEADVKELLPN